MKLRWADPTTGPNGVTVCDLYDDTAMRRLAILVSGPGEPGWLVLLRDTNRWKELHWKQDSTLPGPLDEAKAYTLAVIRLGGDSET